ncbi:hypothetical protein [Streptomyces sp. AN091965]|uniref:hypothetical protein n=1 Tax=Streptomyces sp. AN091965 TaxID=2927803 RepID=UPI001F623A2F|nr:hypothetical protein [Streptomyces sp. AN091965]MCI3930266.1 hypothetical protein [Streptomyces sp. AN091965]
MTRSTFRDRLVIPACAAIATTLAMAVGLRLHDHHVPLLLLLACAGSVLASALDLLFRIVDARHTTTHRCTRSGCTFQVRLTRAGAAEHRRWQRVAAAHPHHTV